MNQSNKETATEKKWTLSALTKALGDIKIDIEDELTVGRGADNDLVLASQKISRQHANMIVVEDELFIKDLRSSNGTELNGELLESNIAKLVKHGDRVSFSGFEFKVGGQTSESQPSNNVVIEKNKEDKEEKEADISENKTSDEQNSEKVEEVQSKEVSIETKADTEFLEKPATEKENLTTSTTTTENEVASPAESTNAEFSNIESSNSELTDTDVKDKEIIDAEPETKNETTNVKPKYATIPVLKKKKKKSGEWIIFVLVAIIIGFAAFMVL